MIRVEKSECDQFKYEAGFTLVETLVALFVFSLIAGASALVLTNSLDSKRVVEERSKAIQELQLARAVIKADLTQVVMRPTREPFGLQDNIGFDGLDRFVTEPILAFSRRGWLNPLGRSARASVQSVSYRLDGTDLVRLSRPRLDPAPDTPTERRVLLQGVEAVSVEFLVNGIWQDEWQGAGYDDTRMPAALALTIDSGDFGLSRQLFVMRGGRP